MGTAMATATAALTFIVLAIGMTWPLARALRTATAFPGDPYINIWILDWDWWATWHQPLSLFDANVFFPARDTLAWALEAGEQRETLSREREKELLAR